MITKRMARWTIAGLLLIAAGATAAGAADDASAMHQYVMRGAIIEAPVDGVYLCIGTADGAKVGEELEVSRVTRDVHASSKGRPKFKHEVVGKIRIDEIVDVHYAKATVISGSVKEHDVAELVEK